MTDLNPIQTVAVWALPVIFAVTLHEAAHGYAARSCGDRTAEMNGRLSLNPMRHIDPIGTVLVPLLSLLLGGIIFGWAKPVPVDERHFGNPRRDMALVAAAGPLANLAMALLWVLALYVALSLRGMPWLTVPLQYMGLAGISINLVLMALNLLPLPPLDGGRLVAAIMTPKAAISYLSIEPYGIFILLALLMTGVLDNILWPPVDWLQRLLLNLAGIAG